MWLLPAITAVAVVALVVVTAIAVGLAAMLYRDSALHD